MAVVLADFTINPYILVLVLSICICACLYALRLKKITGRSRMCAVLTLIMGIVLGAVFSRLMYLVCDLQHSLSMGFGKLLLSEDITLCCFTGGAMGVILSVWLSARLLGINAHNALARFAPVGALLAAFLRFGEIFLINDQIGLGPYIENEAFHFFPAAVCVAEWEEYYLPVFFYEGLACLIVAGVSYFRFHHKHFLRTLFWLCLPQILFQSLLNQNLMWWFFLKVEQFVCVVVCLGVLLRMCLVNRHYTPLWMGIGSVAVCAFAEYALDKITAIPVPVTYGIMAAALAVMGWGGIMCFRKDERFG